MIASGVRVLAYHSLTPWSGDRLGVAPERFRAQMDWLRRKGWRCLSLSEWLDLAESARSPDGPSFVLTFDDGYADNVEIAAPILHELGWSATVFVVTGALETGRFPVTDHPGLEPRLHASPRRSMTWKEAEKWSELGFGIGSHTHTHPMLTAVDRPIRTDELRHSSSLLEERLGILSAFFCYPYGAVDPALEAETRVVGYRGAVRTPASAGVPSGRWTIPRIGIYSHDDMRRFRWKMNRTYPALQTLRQRIMRRSVCYGAAPRLAPIRAVHLTSSTGVGGIERMLPRLAPVLADRDVRMEIFATRPGGAAQELMERLGLSVRVPRSRSVLGQLLDLRSILRWNDYDLLHAYGGRAIVASRLATIGMGRRRPRVVTGVLSTNHARTHLHRLMEHLTQWRSDLFIANAEAVAEEVCTRLHVARTRIRVVHDGIERESLAEATRRGEVRRCLGIPDLSSVLICVANLRPMKGHKTLLAAFEKVLDRFPEGHLLLVGLDQMGGTIQAAAEKTGLRDRVRFLGLRHDVDDLLAASDLFVLASDWEGLPVSILEAMRAAVPIVATRVSGIPEAIRNGVDGLLVPPRDSEGLAEAIVSLLEDRDRACRLGRSAQERMRSQYSIERMAERLKGIYGELLGHERWAAKENEERHVA